MTDSDHDSRTLRPTSRRQLFIRLLPVLVIAVVFAVVIVSGVYHHLSISEVARHYEELNDFVGRHWVMAVAVFMLIYVTVTLFSIPGALVLSITGGLMFGTVTGFCATMISATTGATLVFLIARSSLGEPLARRAGFRIQRLRAGFQANALSYLLFLRLVPVLPFFIVNLAPALLGVPLRTYLLGTVLGIAPATLVYTMAGDGLASAIRSENASFHDCLARQAANPGITCSYALDTGALVTPELLIALLGLGCLALLPAVLNKWNGRNAAV